MKEKGEAPVMFSHLGPVRRRTTAEEEERAKNPRPEDSVYYHPTLNPSGAPPTGKPPMFKSSIGPRIPLPENQAGNMALSYQSETEETTLPLPPPPPPLPGAGLDSGEGAALPLPPPPPMPLIPAVGDITSSLPPPPLPPPPPSPGPPPKELLAARSPLPLPPPVQPPPPGAASGENAKSEDSTSRHPVQMPTTLPPQPPQTGMPPKSGDMQPEGSSSDSEEKTPIDPKDLWKMASPPPPLRPQLQMPGAAMGLGLHSDVPPPGMSRFPPPPTDMRAPFYAH